MTHIKRGFRLGNVTHGLGCFYATFTHITSEIFILILEFSSRSTTSVNFGSVLFYGLVTSGDALSR